MRKNSARQNIIWYEKTRPTYQSLTEIIAATLRALLNNTGIDFIDIPNRAKTMKSFQEKIQRKRYIDPINEMMDLAGVRVITYIEGDVTRVSELIKNSFNVHMESSRDKSTDLGEDRFGYRSVHFVCDIGIAREILPEFFPYKNLMFEIQVRTALQHTWAEIEHDRSYKFSGELPPKIKRRFHLVAGLLELADREFNELTSEIDKYKNEIHAKADAGNLEIELNSTTILEYLSIKLSKTPILEKIETKSIEQEVIDELNHFGIKSLTGLENLFSRDFLEKENKYLITNNSLGILRDAMMYADMNRYFSVAWRNAWSGIDAPSLALLSSKYGESKVQKMVSDCNLDILDSSDDYQEWSDEENS